MGYGLRALSKPLFALAGTASMVLGARFADRIGKGIRGAPRDALVADVTPIAIRGRAFGLRQALDTVGAFLGPLLAIGLMFLFANDMHSVFWMAVIPAVIAVGLLIFGVKDHEARETAAQAPVRINDISRFDGAFWSIVIVGVVFTLARFSEAFLILKVNAEGLPLALAPLVLVVMNIVYSLGSYPAGALSDRIDGRRLLVSAMGCLVLADLILAFVPGLGGAFAGIALWGLHMALSQGLLAKLVADRSPENLRGSAYGIFNLATGLGLLLASVVAGLLWDWLGPKRDLRRWRRIRGGSHAHAGDPKAGRSTPELRQEHYAYPPRRAPSANALEGQYDFSRKIVDLARDPLYFDSYRNVRTSSAPAPD